MEQSLETIAAMRYQEQTGYAARNWLEHSSEPFSSSAMSTTTTPISSMARRPLHEEPVDMECRQKMVTWFGQLVHACHFNTETVEIAMSFLDRFMATEEGMSVKGDRRLYQLASMTSLYTAVKVHEPTALDPRLISELSHGAFSPRSVELMEAKILHAIGWRMHPPTAMSFVHMLLDLLSADAMDKKAKDVVLNISQMQSELAVGRGELLAVSASTIAFASVMNSMECIGVDDDRLLQMEAFLTHALQMDLKSTADAGRIQDILYEAVAEKPDDGLHHHHHNGVRNRSSSNVPTQKCQWDSTDVSPRTIAA